MDIDCSVSGKGKFPMNKVGIITFSKAYNVGAALQAYALQTFLEKHNFEASIIDFVLRSDYQKYNPFAFSFNPKKLGPKIYGLAMNIKRKSNFEEFRKKYLHLTKTYFDGDDMSSLNKDFDSYIAGSDQIWNVDLTGGLIPEFFLSFAEPGKRKIAYAASIGGTGGSGKFENCFQKMKEYISSFDYVSMRESSGAQWIKDNVRGDVCQVLDPSFLLSVTDYNSLIPERFENKNESPFLLAMLYGKRQHNVEQYCEELAKKYGLAVKYIANGKFHNVGSCNLYSISPIEFLYNLKKAQFVVTNSFHCVAFSIIYQKQFAAVYLEEDKDQRVKDLLKLFKLENRKWTEELDIGSAINKTSIGSFVEEHKKHSSDFILSALGKGNNEY